MMELLNAAVRASLAKYGESDKAEVSCIALWENKVIPRNDEADK